MIKLFSFRKSSKGFTLIELMVALFIMSVSTGLLLANYPDSTVRLNLLNNTHDLALLIREAQARGSAIDSVNSSVGGYGVFISKTTLPPVVSFFSDTVTTTKNGAGFFIGNGIFDSSNGDKQKSVLRIKDGFSFKKLCVKEGSGVLLCNSLDATPGSEIFNITVSFMRPSQTAHIFVNNNPAKDYSSACIELNSLKAPASGHIRSIYVLKSGVITTMPNSCN